MKYYFLVFINIFTYSLKATNFTSDIDSIDQDSLLTEREVIVLPIYLPNDFWVKYHVSVFKISPDNMVNNRQV